MMYAVYCWNRNGFEYAFNDHVSSRSDALRDAWMLARDAGIGYETTVTQYDDTGARKELARWHDGERVVPHDD